MFSIRASDNGRIMSVTRVLPAGAALLAEHWVECGFTDVRIEWSGGSTDLAGFHRQFTLTRNGLRPRERVALPL